MKWSKLFLIDLTLMLNVCGFSASVVIFIITRLLVTSRIITQYFNQLLLFNFTASPLKIDEPLSAFQFCHLWLGTFGN